MQLLFSPKILIQENSRFVISELVVGSDEQYIHLQHNSNLHKTDKKNILTMKMEKKNKNSTPKMISTHCVSNKETAKQMSLKHR